jgi:RNA polymerase sigma factor (sigma-70 family)
VIEQSDEMLMQLVKEGDLDKSAILFERYQQKVYNYFMRNTFNKDLSMDMSQNTFFRMLNYRLTYKPQMLFKSWLFGIARNVWLDNFKSKYANTDSLDHIKTDYLIDKEQDKFENEALYHALGALNPDDRELIVMSRFQDIKYEEIAVIMSLSVSAVKVKIHRAIKKLRAFYFEENSNKYLEIHTN